MHAHLIASNHHIFCYLYPLNYPCLNFKKKSITRIKFLIQKLEIKRPFLKEIHVIPT